jgi:hypothetical protein
MVDIQWRIPSPLMNQRRSQCEVLVRLASHKSAGLPSDMCNQLVVENIRQGRPEKGRGERLNVEDVSNASSKRETASQSVK